MSVKPVILLPGSFAQENVDKLKQDAREVVDIYESQLRELARIENPSQSHQNDLVTSDMDGAWVFYPWNQTLLHCVGPSELFSLRTNRNKNLISESEQNKLASTTVGIAGMSVGAGIATALVYSGISTTIKLSDFDELDTSNLNRLRESLLSVGKPKVSLAAQHIYELDPFLTVEQFDKGLTNENIDRFFSDPKLQVVVDEIDDFKMKIKLRLQAKKYGIPLLMFTSLGDNILIDIERYDKDPELLPFHGLIGDITEEILQKDEITPDDIRKFSVSVVGAEYIPTRALASVLEMGKTLVGRPQLYSTIAIDGGLAAYIIRLISLEENISSGRYFVSFADLLKIPNTDVSDSPERAEILNKLFGPRNEP